MEMQPARREVKTWTVTQVAENVAAFLQCPDYARIFMENLVDGELLLDLDREDLKHLGIVKLRDVKIMLRWIANCYDSDENELVLSQIPVSQNVKADSVQVERAEEKKPWSRLLPNKPRQLSYEEKPRHDLKESPTLDFQEGGSRNRISVYKTLDSWFEDITYERIFKGRVKNAVNPSDELFGKRFLRKYHPQAYRVLLHNQCLVRGWFRDLSDPVVSSFFDADFGHDTSAQEALRSFIHKRQPQLGALMFSIPGTDEVVLMRWREDDIYAWVLEFKHYTNGRKRAPLTEIQSREKKPKHDEIELSMEDEELLELCSNGEFNLELWGLKETTTGTELALRDRSCSLLNGLAVETQSFKGDRDVQLFGYGSPVEVVREQPYKVWAVKVLSLLLESSELYVPCGMQFRNHKLQVKTVLEGSVIEMPASYMTLHNTQFLTPADYHDEFSDKPKLQSSDEQSDEEMKTLHTSAFTAQKDKCLISCDSNKDGDQEPSSSSDILVPDLSENEQGVVQDGSAYLSKHGFQGMLKDTEGGIFSIELIIDPEPTTLIPKRIFADKQKKIMARYEDLFCK